MFQLIISPLEEHSKKPAEARKRIVELLGDLPRIELFARQRSPGWDAWGNEVDSSLDMDYRREQDKVADRRDEIVEAAEILIKYEGYGRVEGAAETVGRY